MPDFDHTSDARLPADNYIMTYDIIRLIKAMYMAPPGGTDHDWTTWYEWIGRTEAECFFTPPNFPLPAIQQLGYPQEGEEDIFQDENVSGDE